MSDILKAHDDTVSMGRTTITNHRLADHVDGLEAKETEIANFAQCLDKTSFNVDMKISFTDQDHCCTARA